MDATTELAIALHSAPGVYAVLLGSGVSRGAGIPTGWEVTLDLVVKLAVASGESEPADPSAWYHDRYGEDPDYSGVLQELAPTPGERQALLNSYFEPSDAEREEGLKQPTAAHRAVAELAGRGAIRAVLTTNFDRLVEHALDAAGVAYDVWYSPDAIEGGVPLTHGRVVVVKLHGDYRDTRLLNTLTELASYHPTIDALLDRVFDEFGLVVCGWSGVWDTALREAMLRSPNRRYRTFWAARHGEVADAARRLIDHRAAEVVPIEDGDSFFELAAEKVSALDEISRPHPDSVELAVGMLKRYLPDERDRIRLADVVMEEARRFHRRASDQERYAAHSGAASTVEDVAAVAHRYEADTEVLVNLLAHLGAYGDRVDHHELASRTLELVANPEGDRGGLTTLLAMRRYPALLCFYALGLGAVSTRNWPMLRAAAIEPHWHDLNASEHLVAAIHPYRVFEDPQTAMMLATGETNPSQRPHTPHSDYLHRLLRHPLMPLLDSERRYDEAFDRFECVAGHLLAWLAAVRVDDSQGALIPPPYIGRQRWRHRYAQTDPVLGWLEAEGEALAGSLDGDTSTWVDAKAIYVQELDEARSRAR